MTRSRFDVFFSALLKRRPGRGRGGGNKGENSDVSELLNDYGCRRFITRGEIKASK